jgi:hypothetical protein
MMENFLKDVILLTLLENIEYGSHPINKPRVDYGITET